MRFSAEIYINKKINDKNLFFLAVSQKYIYFKS